MKKVFVYVLLAMLVFAGIGTQGVQAERAQQYGEISFDHVSYLATEIGDRVAGTTGEELARDYIYQTFEQLGYQPEVQSFSFTGSNNNKIHSANVTAVKPGRSKHEIIIGAHYDTVNRVEGVDDNGSGVGVMLEVAEKIQNIDTPYTIRFIAFGAEETGLRGSNYYVSQMTKPEINHTKAMINLDSLAAGDRRYVHGNTGKKGWVRELALDISNELDIDLQVNPGLNPHYPKGTTGNWSDHAAFKEAGIPFAYFESTNWEIGALDGYTQTREHGSIWHNPLKDNMSFIQSEFPGRMKEHLQSYSHILTELVQRIQPNSKGQYMPRPSEH